MLVDLPTIRPHKLSMAVMNGQTLMLVRIRCSDGTVGIGEGTTIGGLAYGAESPEGMKLAIDTYFAPQLIGADANRVPALMDRLVLVVNHVMAAEPQAVARMQPMDVDVRLDPVPGPDALTADPYDPADLQRGTVAAYDGTGEQPTVTILPDEAERAVRLRDLADRGRGGAAFGGGAVHQYPQAVVGPLGQSHGVSVASQKASHKMNLLCLEYACCVNL